jgi:nicotinamidase-related amidase
MNRYLIQPEDCMLLTIDIQQRLYNAMDKDFQKIFVKNSAILLEVAKTFDIPIIISEQYPRGLGRTIDEIENIIEGIPKFEKLFFSCFREKTIRDSLQELAKKTAIIIGIEAHVCVFQTALDLLMAGYRVVVISDAVCSRRKHDRENAIAALDKAGAIILSTETVAFMFLEKAGTDKFKKTAHLFR